MDIIALLLKLLASAAVSSAATPPACPSTTKLKASAAEVNNAVWDFATIFYYQKDIAGAFNKYVASDYIQHNPDFPDGRHTIIDGLASTWANSGTWFTIHHIWTTDTMAFIQLEASFAGGPKMVVYDIYRLDGTCIREHWDVMENIKFPTVSTHPYFG